VLAINYTEQRKPNALANKELEQLSGQVAFTVVLPFDRHVHEGKEIALERLSKQSRRRYLQMAAGLAGMFPRRDIGKL
jgi:MinD-like ATPase involved in chromosome partitioning or flagellar assembly